MRNSNCSGVIVGAPNAAANLRQAGHFCIDGARKFALVVGVCTKPPTISLMVSPSLISANTASEDAVSEISELLACIFNRTLLYVFSYDEPGANVSDDPRHFGPQIDGDLAASRRGAEWLAGKPAADDINGNSVSLQSVGRECSDIVVLPHMGPVLRQDAAAERVYLAESDRLEAARALKAQVEAANTREQGEDAQLAHCIPAASSWGVRNDMRT